MEEILHQTIDGKHFIIYRVLTIQGGAGFIPSTVSETSYEKDTKVINTS